MDLETQVIFGNSVIFRKITSNLPYSDLKDLRLVSPDFNSYVLEYSDFINLTAFKTCPLSLPVLSNIALQFKPKHISWSQAERETGTSFFDDDTRVEGLAQNLKQVESYFSPMFSHHSFKLLLQIFQFTETKLTHLALTESDWSLLIESVSINELEQTLCNLSSLKVFKDVGYGSRPPELKFISAKTFLKLKLPRLETFSLENLGPNLLQIARTNASTITSLRLNDSIDRNASFWTPYEEVIQDLNFPNLKKLTINESAILGSHRAGNNPKSLLANLVKIHIARLTHLTYFTSIFGIDDDLLWSSAATTSDTFKLTEISIIANYIQYSPNTPSFFAKLQYLKSIWLEVPLEPRKPPAGGVHLNIVDVLAMLPATTKKVNLVCIPCESVERRSFRFLLEGFPKPSAEYPAAENLTEVKIRFENSQDDDAVLQRIFTHFVNLKHLSLQNLSCCSYLGFTGISAETGQPVPRMASIAYLRDLQSLSLYGPALTEKMLLDGLKLPKLKYLDLSGTAFSVATYRQLAVQNPVLAELHTNPPPEASKIPPALLESHSDSERKLAWKYPYRP